MKNDLNKKQIYQEMISQFPWVQRISPGLILNDMHPFLDARDKMSKTFQRVFSELRIIDPS